jgi:putative FmdB family regulatory protein
MPVYEYECDKCALRFEVKRGFNETGGNVCPACGGEGRQIFFAAPLHFKGSGFYCTENRKGKDPEAEAAKQPGEAPAKPAAKQAEGFPAGKPAATTAKPASAKRKSE